MTRPRLSDDGRTVVVDFHGSSVDDAVGVIRKVVRVASGRGRGTIRVVHGSSTSDPRARNRTIRHALHDLLDAGELRPWVVDAIRYEGHTLLALAPGAVDTHRISSADLGL